MKISLNGITAYAFTASRDINPELNSVMFIHGAALDHTVWTLPARHFARRGLNVLSVDLPGHGLSDGSCLPEIQQYADWLIDVLDAVGVEKSALVGHSMGSLIALDCASRYPQRIRSMVLVGTAVPMPVADMLLAAAQNDPQQAIEILTFWGHSVDGQYGQCNTPGMWMIGGLMRLFERSKPGALHNDLQACNKYKNGFDAARKVKCPSMLILGEHDYLTPVWSAQKLASEIECSQIIVLPRTGHTIMSERPDELLNCLTKII